MPLPDTKCLKSIMNGRTVFVETGTNHGDGALKAFQSGFKTVYSCEILEESFNISKSRLQHLNAYLYNCSSLDFIKNIIPILEPNFVLWLDAHIDPQHMLTYLPEELDMLGTYISNFDKISILVDDIDHFNGHNQCHIANFEFVKLIESKVTALTGREIFYYKNRVLICI
jgi:hypothetical protein